MTARTTVHGLQVATELYRFIEDKVLPGTGVDSAKFWAGFDAIVKDLAPKNAALLAERDRIQAEMDAWHTAHPGPITDMAAYRAHLEKIGYVVPVPGDVKITTANVDAELATLAGPQLVVPILNARYALNAANARWGSLYDALYGTDAISDEGGAEKGKGYNPVRGAKVIAFARNLLDQSAPLAGASHKDAAGYRVEGGKLVVALTNGSTTGLQDPAKFVGYQGDAAAPTSVLLVNNGLHLDIQINRSTPHRPVRRRRRVGRDPGIGRLHHHGPGRLGGRRGRRRQDPGLQQLAGHPAGHAGRVRREGRQDLHPRPRTPTASTPAPTAARSKLHGRSLMFVRNVGHLMTNPAILWGAEGKEIPEGILDAVVTTTIALHDLQRHGRDGITNSRTGSVYIVKPKMHGPAEVAFAAELFGRVEQVLGLADSTVKLGIMDEERRTSANLKACIAAASSRVAFINTGFLDRTGDEMHTAMLAGPMMRKGDMKTSAWIAAYERRNVLIGLECGLSGKAQIGKGMWAMPDLMAGMLEQKIAHPKAGCQHRLGALAHWRHAARHSLPPGERGPGARRDGRAEGRSRKL